MLAVVTDSPEMRSAAMDMLDCAAKSGMWWHQDIMDA
jgi:hypothetical protein